jgi:signal peptidase I
LLGAILAALVVRAPQVSGFSMTPRIESGEFVLINTLAFRLARPARGDIVAFRHDRSTPAIYLKRVIGLPGERVAVSGGVVRVNGVTLREAYVRFNDGRDYGSLEVPPETYYMLGDNRANSDDSRAWGPVPARDVVGKAILAVWPLDRIGTL